ncbi:diaminohydroxyphosphoribosylaminopyrimidine deaminase [Propionigenium maris DSM 9537]|uniref:Dihydrofolate synthase/folylpolyglutamate synthase n=1 Tax=Propionigenium maris DSM 9537 TaxID=1123000 RepID=A0A9W6GLR9_9FUSO|nr:diaminohydroxyphosphoribosylaminopyrimidine deaminase [Propionigenium maris DSM 9537]
MIDEKVGVEKVLEELYNYSMFGIKLGLENIKNICEALGEPQRSYRVIHIAGTNGKGSTATTIERGLIEAGYKVGKFTSPHIVRFNERIQLNGVEISDEKICEYFLRVKEVLEEREIRGTFFEVTTAMMFLYFKDENIDFLVLETGMGGRFDATNIVDSEIAVITNISLDHTGFLGDDIYTIAKEKAGIIKAGSKVVVGDSQEDVARAIEDEKDDYTDVLKKYRDVSYRLDTKNYTTEIELQGRKYSFSLFGNYQVNNFLCAYEVLKTLNISEDVIERAATKVSWPGRFEVAGRAPLLILDGAHNVDAAKRLRENINLSYREDEVVAIVSVLEDKDIQGVMEEIRGFTDTIILTSLADFKRGLKGEDLLKYTDSFQRAVVREDIDEAYKEALSLGKGAVVVCGSFYLLSKFKGR